MKLQPLLFCLALPLNVFCYFYLELSGMISSQLMAKFLYRGILNYADSLCIKASPIFYIANRNPNQTVSGPEWKLSPA